VWRGIITWDKTEGARPTKGGFRNQAEYIVWGTKGKLETYEDSPYLPGVFRQVVLQADKHHLTGKPTNLMRELVRVVPAGGVVLDPFMGSGTTGVACVQMGLSFIGVEQNAVYQQIARWRIEEAAGGLRGAGA
jgi:site-specific DNA-methyltransferase (adenine-specific)